MPAARWLAALAAALALTLAARAAAAWATTEHIEIGQAAYTGACGDLLRTAAARGAPNDAVSARLEIVCGRNQATMAALYGDACAIAGDFLGHPDDFLSQAGAWTFKSKKHYLLLALENVKHFNPMATQAWADYHQRALAHGLAGAAAQGLASIAEMQLAIQESAFADHFLQDSFAAGHMGFNRTASSAAAAKRFHDTWNALGRRVRDRAGHSWLTYGDGRLADSLDADGRQHVVDAATLSVRGVLAAFVFGQPTPADELAIWNALPFAIEAPELRTGMEELFVSDEPPPPQRPLVPLMTTIRPAHKGTIAMASFWSFAPFSDAGAATVAGLAGVELPVPFLSPHIYLGAGGTLREPSGAHSAVVDTGIVLPIGLSVSGLLSHQLDVTASWIFRTDLDVALHAEYRLNLELGDTLFSAEIGIAELLPDARTAWYGGLAVGYNFSTVGGGAF
jgi:hypothetical protein